MPGTVLPGTNQFILKNKKIRKLCKFFEYITDLQIIDFRNNSISSVCETFANKVREGRNATSPWNQLYQIWLSGNPFHCNCSMTWMVGWLNNFTTSNGEHVIVDYENFTCKSGMVIGKPIHLLNEDKMAEGWSWNWCFCCHNYFHYHFSGHEEIKRSEISTVLPLQT